MISINTVLFIGRPGSGKGNLAENGMEDGLERRAFQGNSRRKRTFFRTCPRNV